MIGFFSLYRIELAKLRRTLVLWMAFVAPALVLILQVGVWLRSVDGFKEGLDPWMIFYRNVSSMWGVFMLPLFTALAASLIYHMEHTNQGWLRLYSFPVERWVIPAAKAAIVLTMILTASLVLALGSILGVLFVDAVKPGLDIHQPIPFAEMAIVAAKVLVASLLLVAIQNAISFRFSSISVSLGVGIGGTFVAMFATAWKYGYLFPWLMPLRSIHGAAGEVTTCLLLSSGLSLLLLTATIFYGAKRDPGLLTWHTALTVSGCLVSIRAQLGSTVARLSC